MRGRVWGLALMLGGCTAPHSGAAPARSELAGKVAGAPQRCVLIERDQALRVDEGDRHMLLYGYGRKIWANRLAPNCGFNRGDVLVIKPIGSDYCRGDLRSIVRSGQPLPGPFMHPR